MLDKVAMITMLILYTLFTLISLFIYLIIRASDEYKTDEERQFEDEEQMNYLKKYKKNLKTGRN